MSFDEESGHTIWLDDRTAPLSSNEPPTPNEPPTTPKRAQESEIDKTSGLHRPRAGTLRKELTRRRYARYQEGRYNEDEEADTSSGPSDPKHARNISLVSTSQRIESHRPSLLRPPRPFRAKKARKRAANKEFAVDILYENQRGWFFCGIPLYSSKSLLNFDPAPWQTGDFQDSPVNITNAQVPDPTWVWAWPSWYVDMSHDVDEEGWEYSFSFRQGFAWHGSQPWLTSFVRRRRWLRKRVRAHTLRRIAPYDALHDAHHFNTDYFTIHASADTDSSLVGGSTLRSAALTSPEGLSRPGDVESDSDDDDLAAEDIASLLRILRRTTVDRKKLDAFHNFLASGGSELYFLSEAMPDILALFMYQHSRHEVLVMLEKAATFAADQERSQNSVSDGNVKSADSQYVLNLNRAIAAIVEPVHRLSYTPADAMASNSLHRPNLPSLMTGNGPNPSSAAGSGSSSSDVATDHEAPLAASPTRAVGQDGSWIKGIPAAAHIGEDVGLAARMELVREPEHAARER